MIVSQGYEKDPVDTRIVFYGIRYIIETHINKYAAVLSATPHIIQMSLLLNEFYFAHL